MTTKELKYGSFIIIVILLAYIIPYTLLTNVAAWYGSFLFWSLLALVIIVINYFLTRDWGE
ncbi:hypothetical protein GCM10011351_24510 [Paraliobacillus quinghaiensis]|uniref:Uncharacterized protein n=1 Tax=Paraliobacillus quinghaiensis TaxID=470815 RepID=A0A917TU15_9BACI|nr:hypothetical protein [Paraliobacillus quinghaiensis]GGM37388.1 hypothetical protein GCM10011351_24510 [Paraliobacillus quinghaiensis]